MAHTHILVDKEESVATITINRPEILNAMNHITVNEMLDAIKLLTADKSNRVIVITGSGDKAFVSGAELAFEASLGPLEAYEWCLLGHRLMSLIEEAPIPVIASINGYALGGGLDLTLACDLRIASENAKFGVPNVNLGSVSGFGGNLRLPRLVGRTKATEMLLLGEMIDAEEAYRIGLLNRVVPQKQLAQEVKGIAKKLAEKSSLAIRLTKSAIVYGLEANMKVGAQHEAELYGLISSAEDKLEGLTAFSQKREPRFKY